MPTQPNSVMTCGLSMLILKSQKLNILPLVIHLFLCLSVLCLTLHCSGLASLTAELSRWYSTPSHTNEKRWVGGWRTGTRKKIRILT